MLLLQWLPGNVTKILYGHQIQTLLQQCFQRIISDFQYWDNWAVACYKDQVVGTLMIDVNGSLWNICTRPDMRGKGIATKLITFVQRISAYRPLTLAVNLNKPTAQKLIKFYQKFGFVPHRQQKNKFWMIEKTVK